MMEVPSKKPYRALAQREDTFVKKLIAILAAATASSSLLVIAPSEESEASSPQSPEEVHAIQHELNGFDNVAPNFIREAWCQVFSC